MEKKKIFTVAIIGCGSRGLDSYALAMTKHGGFKIEAVCDIRETKLDLAKKLYNLKQENCFLDEDEFFKEKRADVCVVATQDKQHVNHAIKALKIGYDILLEKPISPSIKECKRLLKAQKKYNKVVIVCHVLRYANAFTNVYKLISDGTIGKLININALEQVGFWHIAHSYVRGNWRKEEETSPMILAKCCHDLDLLQWYACSKCECISSNGELTYFKKENKPIDASSRCSECKYKLSCPYSAEWVYISRWKKCGSPDSMWPSNVVCDKYPLSEEYIRESYQSNQYGRCVFECDNDVVDHQITNMVFENGVTANLTMMGFTGSGGRIYKFHGTLGEIDLDEEAGQIVIKKFTQENKIIPFAELPDVSGGHGGGDAGIVESLYQSLLTNKSTTTSLQASIESHLMAFAADKSRHHKGRLIKIH